MKEKKPGGTRPEMGTPEYEEWRKTWRRTTPL